MHAAVLHEHGATPVYEPFEEPVAGEGQAVVEVAVAGVNPVDVRKASGGFVSGPPPLPSVVGTEGVGRTDDGRRVYFDAPLAPFGAFAERALVQAGDPIDLPDEVEDGVAVALGIAGLAAWLPLAWRAQLRPGETVLVLGATGVVGQLAVQAARLLGAGRVVAAGRDAQMLARAERLGADATVNMTDVGGDDLTAAFRAAAGGDVDVVHDPLWGAPAAAAVEALGVGGRLVQLGQSAGPDATISSASVRGRHLDIRGYLNFLVPPEMRRDAYRALIEHAAAGRIAVDAERIPLAQVADAWERVQRSPHRKLVLVP